MQITVSGTLAPNCAVASAGEPAGEKNGQPYWTWQASGVTWYLWYRQIGVIHVWQIADSLEAAEMTVVWVRLVLDPLGDYAPQTGATGTATVSQYVAPVAEKLLVVEWLGASPARYTILRELLA